ncbi:aldehyde dehydrogenase family protein [Vibrio astriarenae]|uniref:Aldehyde dehydrogenase family protein n=1 Tax=Vibrio astriarenae TaxID=1481923 RepID=A0A7Z2T7D7_9VIBR|nr:aldehyde dehydrogenase family protein [Vibrio astriarenae]QIA65637.1 aldehyde dehydrogenase family protein [Vibrio astriarenae]
MYIDGKLIENDCKYSVINPATDEIVQEISVANKETAQVALSAAKEAEKTWGKTTVAERVKWMNKLRDALIRNEEALRMAVHQETGKSWACTEEDYQSLIDSLAFYSEEIKRYTPPTIIDTKKEFTHQLRHLPIGVVVAYLSWNFPLLNLGFKLGPAMAAGCPIILKPSIKAPLSAYLVGQICHEIGLPKGAVNVFAGNDREVGNYLSSSKIPQMLTLIGSISTGVKVMQAGATSIKRYSMELGGNTPFIVCEDADLDLAADILCALKYNNSGQICVAPNRVMVAQSVQKEFLEKVTERADRVAVGYDIESDFVMGPVIDKWERDRIHGLVEDALSRGATLVRGGTFDRDEVGAFYPPTVITDVTTEMDIYQEEIFGPVISMITIDDNQDVIAMANATDTGLASYIFSKDTGKAQRMADQLEFGEVQINGVKYGIDLPHVGIKQSGIGCDCSKFALEDYLYLARITEAL